MAKEPMAHEGRIDQFFSGPGARADHWRDLQDAAQAWAAGQDSRTKFEGMLAELAATEEYHAYPGARLLAALRDSAAADDARSTHELVRRISTALLTRSFRRHAGDWEVNDESDGAIPDILPPTLGRGELHRPYFETLIVTGLPAERWPGFCAEWRRLRRPLDQFVY
jgi:arginine decarboxylase